MCMFHGSFHLIQFCKISLLFYYYYEYKTQFFIVGGNKSTLKKLMKDKLKTVKHLINTSVYSKLYFWIYIKGVINIK